MTLLPPSTLAELARAECGAFLSEHQLSNEG